MFELNDPLRSYETSHRIAGLAICQGSVTGVAQSIAPETKRRNSLWNRRANSSGGHRPHPGNRLDGKIYPPPNYDRLYTKPFRSATLAYVRAPTLLFKMDHHLI